MPNGRLLNRDDIDKIFPDNPVRIDHVSMHGTVLNSLALKNTVTMIKLLPQLVALSFEKKVPTNLLV